MKDEIENSFPFNEALRNSNTARYNKLLKIFGDD